MVKIIGDDIEELYLMNELLEVGELNCSDDIRGTLVTKNLDVYYSLKDGGKILSMEQLGSQVIVGYKSEDGKCHFLDQFKYLEGE